MPDHHHLVTTDEDLSDALDYSPDDATDMDKHVSDLSDAAPSNTATGSNNHL